MAYGETYEEFVEKFKPKKTTDDCYTPPLIYEAVKGWAIKEYNWDFDALFVTYSSYATLNFSAISASQRARLVAASAAPFLFRIVL